MTELTTVERMIMVSLTTVKCKLLILMAQYIVVWINPVTKEIVNQAKYNKLDLGKIPL